MAAKIIPFPGITANDNSGASPVPPQNSFEVAYYLAMIAKAERELIEAKAMLTMWSGESTTDMLPAREYAWSKAVLAMHDMTAIPAADARQLKMKRGAVGRIWMQTGGEIFDCMRDNIARDEMRMKRKAV